MAALFLDAMTVTSSNEYTLDGYPLMNVTKPGRMYSCQCTIKHKTKSEKYVSPVLTYTARKHALLM